jgi:hypothetical protein
MNEEKPNGTVEIILLLQGSADRCIVVKYSTTES